MADFMTTDYSKNTGNNYEPVPTGNYEMIINKVTESATKNGAESLDIDLLIRNDVDKALPDTNGKYHNRHVFMHNWKRKATNQYDLENFQYILQAVGVPEGTKIQGLDDFIKLISGAAVRVFVKKEENTYQGKTQEQNQVAPWNFEKTQFPNIQHEFPKGKNVPPKNPFTGGKQAQNAPDPFAGSDDRIDISDDDVPF